MDTLCLQGINNYNVLLAGSGHSRDTRHSVCMVAPELRASPSDLMPQRALGRRWQGMQLALAAWYVCTPCTLQLAWA